MIFEPRDNRPEPPTEEFEKLEFLPEQPTSQAAPDADSDQINFGPEVAPSVEPPVSFVPDAAPQTATDPAWDVLDLPGGDLEFDAATPFELFGSSLFADSDLEDDDLLDDLIF